MKKKVFWIGEIALVVEVALLYYDFSPIQNIYAIHTELKQRCGFSTNPSTHRSRIVSFRSNYGVIRYFCKEVKCGKVIVEPKE